jgi:hypothetical protein
MNIKVEVMLMMILITQIRIEHEGTEDIDHVHHGYLFGNRTDFSSLLLYFIQTKKKRIRKQNLRNEYLYYK